MADFVRLYRTNMIQNSIWSNSINYVNFLGLHHILAYDLTTASDGGTLAFATPDTRLGEMKIQLTFNEVVPAELNLALLCISESKATIQIDHTGRVSKSYSTSA